MPEHQNEKSNHISKDIVSYIVICVVLIAATIFYIWWNTPVKNTLPEVYGVM